MEAFKYAMEQIDFSTTKRIVSGFVTKNIPSAADRPHKLGEDILLHSGKERKWAGPFMFLNGKGTMIAV